MRPFVVSQARSNRHPVSRPNWLDPQGTGLPGGSTGTQGSSGNNTGSGSGSRTVQSITLSEEWTLLKVGEHYYSEFHGTMCPQELFQSEDGTYMVSFHRSDLATEVELFATKSIASLVLESSTGEKKSWNKVIATENHMSDAFADNSMSPAKLWSNALGNCRDSLSPTFSPENHWSNAFGDCRDAMSPTSSRFMAVAA